MSSIVAIDRLSFSYPPLHEEDEPEWVLNELSLDVEEGEFVSVMGPTGVGKTTFCLALNGIVPHSTGGIFGGNVTIGGLNTRHCPVGELARHVGLVFQEPETQLFNLTVEAEVAVGLENLGVPRPEMIERVEWALSLVGMNDVRQRSPFNLSGGQKQRVAIASILAMQPRVLVLDEPTANLDPLGKQEVFAVVRQLRQEQRMTIIMVSHESEQIAEFSDRVVVLQSGRVVLSGAPDRVFRETERMHDIGLAVPQVSELASCLNARHNTTFAFTRLEEAYRTLVAQPADEQERAT